MAVGDLITASRFNNLQSRIATLMGKGSGTDGYGQSLNSFQVLPSSACGANEMTQLYLDMAACYIHQVGGAPNSISPINFGDNSVIAEDTSYFINDDGSIVLDPAGDTKGLADFETLIATLETNKFSVASSQAALEAGITSVRSSSWNGTIVHQININFSGYDTQNGLGVTTGIAPADHRRAFFNSGGEIRFSANLSSGSGAKTNDWRSILSDMGTIVFNYDSTTNTGIRGTVASNLGFYGLTDTYQTIFSIGSTSGIYGANDYNIKARLPDNSTLQFKIEFNDDSVNIPPSIDENVTGVLTSRVDQFRASGNYVNVRTPTYSNVTRLE